MKPWLPLPLAYLVISRLAGEACPARAYEGHGHSVAHPKSCDGVVDVGDDPRYLVTGGMRERGDVAVVALPSVPVAATQSGSGDLQDNAAEGGSGVG